MRIHSYAFIVIAVATAPQMARAEPSASARAAELNTEAAEHAKHGEWDVAAALLAAAYKLTPDPSLLVNLAATELKANRGVDALHHLRAYLGDPSADPKVRDAINAQLLPRAMAATGHVTVHFPLGAHVSMDSAPLSPEPGSTAMIVDVMPGNHVLEVTGAGWSHRQSLDVGSGASADVVATPASAPPQRSPVATVRASQLPPPLAVDKHETGFWTAGHVVPLTLLVAGVGAAGVGAGFALGASSASSQASGCPAKCPPNYGALHTAFNRDSELSTALFIGAGALGGAAIVTWLLWPRESAEAPLGSVTIQPVIAASEAGIAGHF
jgi:hypothetical protein